MEKPARWCEKLESGGVALAGWKQPRAGNGTVGPTDSLGCLDESAYLGGWGGRGAQFPFLEKGGLPATPFSATFCIAASNCPEGPLGRRHLHRRPHRSGQARPTDAFTALVGGKRSPYTGCCFPAWLTHNGALLRHGDSAKETSVVVPSTSKLPLTMVSSPFYRNTN